MLRYLESHPYWRWYRIFVFPFLRTFPPDRFDPVYLTFNGLDANVLKLEELFESDLSTRINKIKLKNKLFSLGSMLAAFFSIPNGDPNRKNRKQAAILTFLKNVVGWHEDAEKTPTWVKILNYSMIKPILTVAWNLLSIIPAIIKNTLKLITEYLPLLLAEACKLGAKKCAEILKEEINKGIYASTPTIIFAHIGRAAAHAGFYLFSAIHFIGRAMTSPITGIRAAYKLGEDICGKHSTEGKILGTSLSMMSGVLTVVAYTLLFPLAIKALAIHVTPHIVNVLPPQLASVVTTIGNAFTPSLAAVGNHIHLLGSGLFQALGVSPAHLALATIVSAAITTVGVVVSDWKETVKNHMFNKENKVPVFSALANTITGIKESLQNKFAPRAKLSDQSNAEVARQQFGVDTAGIMRVTGGEDISLVDSISEPSVPICTSPTLPPKSPDNLSCSSCLRFG